MVKFQNRVPEPPTVTWKMVILGTGLSDERLAVCSHTLSFASSCLYVMLRPGEVPVTNRQQQQKYQVTQGFWDMIAAAENI